MELDLLKPFFELKKLNKPTACYNCGEFIQIGDEFPAVADLYRKLIFKGKYVLCSRNCLKIKVKEYIERENKGDKLTERIEAKRQGVNTDKEKTDKIPEIPTLAEESITDSGFQLPLVEPLETPAPKNFEPSAALFMK